ncbi:unnamed protein product [Closterium sp. NIES-65]|nr:unnamed protein product [Closterium sp. NIES-65]
MPPSLGPLLPDATLPRPVAALTRPVAAPFRPAAALSSSTPPFPALRAALTTRRCPLTARHRRPSAQPTVCHPTPPRRLLLLSHGRPNCTRAVVTEAGAAAIGSPSRRAAQQPSRRATQPPSCPAAEPPSSRAAEPPSRRAAEPPSRPTAEPPYRRAARAAPSDDLQLFLQCDRADGLSLFDLTSGASRAPAADADATVRSQWATRDAAARLAVRRHLPTSERAHFSQYKSAQTLYDAVVARYSSPATAALSRLMLPYLFLDLAAFPTVADLITHLRTSDTRYRAALPADFCAKNRPPPPHVHHSLLHSHSPP